MTSMKRPNLQKPQPPFQAQRVLVLGGGWSHERDVSSKSAENVAKALQSLGHNVELFNPPRHTLAIAQGIDQSFGGKGPEVIFNILHGREVEDGVIQGLLTLTGLPYTFSGVLGSALAMHKGIACSLVSQQGVRCPEGRVLSLEAYAQEGFPQFPHVVKPPQEGSTVGLRVIHNAREADELVRTWTAGPELFVETYIPGRELTVAVFDGVAAGVLEIEFEGEVFAFEPKYTPGKAKHLVPAPLPEEVTALAMEFAEIAHKTLKCQGVTRADLRYDASKPGTSGLYFLELNTQPGMTAISLVPDIAAALGWTYEDVVQWILMHAQHHDTLP